MDINWNLYKYFFYACKYESITKVAQHFYITQPAISKQIKSLEQQLGYSLIRTNNKGIQPTAEGQKLYDMLKPAFEILNDIETEFSKPLQDSERTISLSANYISTQKIILPTITKFNKIYPNIKFKLETSPFEDSAKKLKEGKLDLFFYGYDRLGSDDDNIIKKECYKMKHAFVVSSKIKNDFPDKISIYDINKYPLLVIDSAGESRMELEKMLSEKNIQLVPKREFSTYWALKNSIENNYGIGFLNIDHIKDEIESGKLIQIPTIEDIPQVPLYCAYLRNNMNKKIIQEFIDFIKENFYCENNIISNV